MTVEIIKGTKRLSAAHRIICQRGLPYKRLLLLPIPTTKDGVVVNGTDVTLDSLTLGVGVGDAVAGYGLPSRFVDKLTARGARVYDAMYDEQFQQKNAELTVIGALGDIITAKDRAPSDVTYGIIGYGRIGSALLKYLLMLGASATVFTRRESVRIALGEWGIKSSSSTRLEDYMALDVLINTAPTTITDARGVGALYDAGVSVFDLASGENFDHSDKVVRLPGVPDRVYPKSAGEAYANALCDALGAKA